MCKVGWVGEVKVARNEREGVETRIERGNWEKRGGNWKKGEHRQKGVEWEQELEEKG